ncbi:MAG: helix-turn-helix transcriptional regulator [Polyangia bacterium]|jgi:transcriptional regulator with XRE-family HTH domain
MSDTSVSRWLRYVAANTRRLRRKQGWTQEVLAEKAGMEVRYVQEIERAKTNMTLAILVDLASALGVHPRVMLNEAEMKPAKPGRPRKARRPAN